MTTNDMDAEALLLDLTCFALDAEASLRSRGWSTTHRWQRPAYAARSQARRPGMRRP